MSLWKCNACQGTYNDTEQDGTVYAHACSPAPPNAQGIQAELPNKRDESIVVDSRGRARDIKSAGVGVTPMQGQLTAEPQWILTMRAQHASLLAPGL